MELLCYNAAKLWVVYRWELELAWRELKEQLAHVRSVSPRHWA
ncbi:MAG TPA: hypothetical protein VEL76_06215 [Gemmataceae bacterium]|nr:hypothetical protein [Gemmataceae bacterium]